MAPMMSWPDMEVYRVSIAANSIVMINQADVSPCHSTGNRINIGYKKLQENMEEVKKRLKTNEALSAELLKDIEIFRKEEVSRRLKFESKLDNLHQNLKDLTSKHVDIVSHLTIQLTKKKDMFKDLKDELGTLKNKNCKTKEHNVNVVDINLNNNWEVLSNENEMLKQDCENLELKSDILQKQFNDLITQREKRQEQITQYKENLKNLNEALADQTKKINVMKEECEDVKFQLSSYTKPSFQQVRESVSLFTEVNDKRQHLQETVDQMKNTYIKLKHDHLKYQQSISSMKITLKDLKKLMQKDLEDINEDNYKIIHFLETRQNVLQEIIDRRKKTMTQIIDVDHLNPNEVYKLFQEEIKAKEDEIKYLKDKLTNSCLIEHRIGSLNVRNQRDLAMYKMKVQELELKLSSDFKEETSELMDDFSESIYEKSETFNVTKDETISNQTVEENKENKFKSKKVVKFTEDIAIQPENDSLPRKGRKIFIMKKKK
ncbi:hypothetical protein ABEB36_013856 [Hypothenemus hampei]|uniref:Uncharacterized protein n=1 Tax=Hypothenemus hampei TaxID=57062 RepID=A0ABD1E5T0_HYPHA